MVKITIELSEEHDRKLKHILADKNLSSKASFIEQVMSKYIDEMKLGIIE